MGKQTIRKIKKMFRKRPDYELISEGYFPNEYSKRVKEILLFVGLILICAVAGWFGWKYSINYFVTHGEVGQRIERLETNVKQLEQKIDSLRK